MLLPNIVQKVALVTLQMVAVFFQLNSVENHNVLEK